MVRDIHDFIFREEWTNVPQQKCKTVINQECTTVQRTVTNNVPEQKCHDVQTDVCVNVPRPSCTTVTDKVESKVIHLFSPLVFYKTGFYTILLRLHVRFVSKFLVRNVVKCPVRWPTIGMNRSAKQSQNGSAARCLDRSALKENGFNVPFKLPILYIPSDANFIDILDLMKYNFSFSVRLYLKRSLRKDVWIAILRI